MMKNSKLIQKSTGLLAFMLLSLSGWAQNAAGNTVTMADKLRSSGKIYVVVAVIFIIFIGIVVYLIGLDRKIGKIEKEVASTSQKEEHS